MRNIFSVLNKNHTILVRTHRDLSSSWSYFIFLSTGIMFFLIQTSKINFYGWTMDYINKLLLFIWDLWDANDLLLSSHCRTKVTRNFGRIDFETATILYFIFFFLLHLIFIARRSTHYTFFSRAVIAAKYWALKAVNGREYAIYTRICYTAGCKLLHVLRPDW